MNLDLLLWLGNPITWLVAMMMVAGWSRMFGRQRGSRVKCREKKGSRRF